MTRSRSAPLFISTEPEVYLIDTSAWINIEERPDCEDIWRMVIALIEQGRIVVCAQVFEELKRNAFYASHLHKYEDVLRAGDEKSDDPDYLQHIGRITHDHPAMSKATSRKTPADPYIIALAQREGYVVVADETTTKKRNRKIPGVCEKLKIKCLTLDEFIADNKSASAPEKSG